MSVVMPWASTIDHLRNCIGFSDTTNVSSPASGSLVLNDADADRICGALKICHRQIFPGERKIIAQQKGGRRVIDGDMVDLL